MRVKWRLGSKYGSIACYITPKGQIVQGISKSMASADWIRFDSLKEARHWQSLQLLKQAGEIFCLERQRRFDLHALGGKKVATFVADFVFQSRNGSLHVQDVKSPPTRKKESYRIKARWMLAEYGITIEEV
jgi:hypothetical protein